ncbi:MAG: peptidylprolyl isomerase [Myxococcales bacterium]|nr:peptidylprolyl isomerase [Myxococcales bacterium]
MIGVLWGSVAWASVVPSEEEGKAAAPPALDIVEEPAEVVAPPPEPPAVPRWAHPALTDPDQLSSEPAPDTFRVRFDTTAGPFVVEVVREWAPRGVDRFHGLVQAGVYDGMSFYRVVPDFVVQWGLSPYPAVNTAYREAKIPDDPVVSSNERGRVTFAMAGPNTRTCQLYINLRDNVQLDRMGFAPFGTVVEGMDVVDALYGGYGEGAPRGAGPSQGKLGAKGDAALVDYPKLDLVRRAAVVP